MRLMTRDLVDRQGPFEHGRGAAASPARRGAAVRRLSRRRYSRDAARRQRRRAWMLARPAIACGARRALPVGGREDASVSASNRTPAAVLRATADVAKLVWMRCLQPHPLLMAVLGSAEADRKVGLRLPRRVVHALRAHEP